MAKILIAPVSTGLSADAAAKAFAAALNAQVFQAVDSTTEALLAQGKSDDWFDALVGKVAALNADNLVIEGITPDADKLFLAGKNVELALSLDAGVVLALKSDNTDAAAVTQQLNLTKQLYTNSPGLLEGFIIDGAAAALGAQVAEQTGLTFFGSSDKLQDVSALAKREAKRLSPAQFRYNLIDFARKADMRIVLPEGEEPRILQATKRLVKETEVIPVLLGNPEKIKIYLEIEGIEDGYEVIDPQHYPQFEEMVTALVERRKGKMSEEDARKVLVEDVNYFGVMLVYLGLVDGMVSGAIHSTASTVRPALQIIKTRPNVTRTSGAFLMVRGTERYLFGDCAININPDAEALAEIAINSAITAKMFGIEPKIAMLSYSTKGSGFGESVDKVVEATKIAHDLRPDLEIDGELQFDAAFVPETAALKAPGSTVAGQANVFIFPGIEAGNIGYKMAERLGGFAAVGPVLQGLNKPVNDLSRGCNADDVYKLTLITAAQAVHQ